MSTVYETRNGSLATTLGLNRAAWDRLGETTLKGATALVVGAWALMAWSRFGTQGITAPRVAVRFVLIGFYGWIALAGLIWLAGRFLGPSEAPPVRILQFTGLAHRPLIIFGFVIQFAAVLLRLNGPGVVLAVAALGIWMPAMLVAAVQSAFRLPPARAALVVAVPYLAWFIVFARYLLDQIGHLL